LQNYYTILGISNFASQAEVKNAFRRMAKLYHPDVNPAGQEQFKLIAKAYGVLSESYQKSQYDYRLKQYLNVASQKTTTTKQTTTKTYEFTEQELKRRQYYQEHYKKQYEESKNKQYTTQHKSSNNEFKSILVATPLAVFLVMIILNVWSTKPDITVVPYKEEVPKKEIVIEKKNIATGDTPYRDYLGGFKEDTLAKRSLMFKNMSGNDMIIFLFSKNEFIRSCYVEHGYEINLQMLPKELSKIRIMLGKNFEYVKELPRAGVYGAFTQNCKFYEYAKKLKLDGTNQLTLTNVLEEGFIEVVEDNFFKKDS